MPEIKAIVADKAGDDMGMTISQAPTALENDMQPQLPGNYSNASTTTRLLFPERNLLPVVNEVVQREDGPDEGGQVDDQHHVVGLDGEGARQLTHVQVWQQVEHILGSGK